MSGSLYFNGASYLTFPSSSDWAPGTGDFTVEWFQYISDFNLAPSNFPRVFSVGAYNSNTVSIAATIEGPSISPTLFFWAEDIPNGVGVGSIVDQWVHFAISRQGNSLHLFKNGEELLGSPIENTASISDASTVLTIGQEYPVDVANSYFTGSITNFRWVNGSALYSASFAVPSFPLEPVAGCVLLLSASGSDSFLDDSSGTGKLATNYGTEFTGDNPFPFFPFPTPTPTITLTPTVTETETPTPTPTVTDTSTPTPTPTPTPTLTVTPTLSPTVTQTETVTPTPSVTDSPTPTPTVTITPTLSPTVTLTVTPTPTATPLPLFSIVPTGIRPRYSTFDFSHPNDPCVHISNYETVTPSDLRFYPGTIITLKASQNRYSFDYFEVWEPNKVIESTCAYPTIFGFVASFDPNTKVQLNSVDDISGSNAKIVARYR